MKSQLQADNRQPTPGASIDDRARLRVVPRNTPSEPDLPPALGGERIVFGGVNCYMTGSGPPLVLVHSINAASSAAEMRPLYERYGATHTVFAIDLPGFGLSDRSDRRYDPRLMTDALQALAEQVLARCGAVPIDAVAVSLGCEFLVRAAVELPMRWGRLALVSPTGLSGTKPRRGPPGSTRAMPWLHAFLSAPAWTQALYRGLTKPAVIRYFLQRTWGSKSIDETLWAYDVLTARQPGARFAPLHFLSGGLFSQDIHDIYEAAPQPVWMSHGVRGDFKDFRGKRLVRDRGNWQTTVYQTGALPYFEVPLAFYQDFDGFLGRKISDQSAATQGQARPDAAHNLTRPA
jgi:pimeloyl-ACP methyl ester carboxylesterase